MMIVDNLLQDREREGRPIRVGMIGAGFMAQGLVNTIENSVPGMQVARSTVGGSSVAPRSTSTPASIQRGGDHSAVPRGRGPHGTARRDGRCRPPVPVGSDRRAGRRHGIGRVRCAVVLDAFEHGKHVILMNAELDATIGPILHRYAQRHGVIMSACDGDEPGVQMNLYRWVRGLGLVPRVIGNVKGLQDPYRNPDTQRGFAEKWGQNPAMVTSFADGSKISFEQTIAANATGFKVQARGMSRGVPFDGSPLDLPSLYDIDEVRALGGIVDYTVGPSSVKVFCLAEHSDPKQRHYLNLYKLGDGPLYPFWIPYHLPTFEAPNAIARVVLLGDGLAPPLAGPSVEVCAVAKQDLRAGDVLDDYGMFMTYGEAVNVEEMSAGRYLPEGLVEGCRLRTDIARDEVISYDDVELPAGRIADNLRAEQYRHFRGETWLEERLLVAA